MRRHLLTIPVVSLGVVGAGSGPARAAGFQPGLGGPDPGIPAGFGALFVIVVILGIGTTIWRISMVRGIARKSGMDPDDATAVTLLSDDGLGATYLAANLRDRPTDAKSAQTTRPADERLRELQALRDQGLVSDQEYETRRQAIIDSI